MKDTSDYHTNYCTHENNSPIGVCDKCMGNKDTLKERENILEKPDVLASTVIVRTDNVYEKYISEDKVRQIIEQTRKEERERCISIIEPYWDEAPVDEVINKIKFND